MSFKSLVIVLGAFLAIAAVILQFYLIMENRTASVAETIIRFFSFFTILTNSLVAIYFTTLAFFGKLTLAKFFNRMSVVTAITVYITLVGGVYQIILRHVWEPKGLQMLVDEALHTVIPGLFVLYWLFLVPKEPITWKSIFSWMIYPLVYFAVVILRGSMSGFYPYPFVNVSALGMQKVLINALMIIVAFAVLSTIFLLIARSMSKPLSPGGQAQI